MPVCAGPGGGGTRCFCLFIFCAGGGWGDTSSHTRLGDLTYTEVSRLLGEKWGDEFVASNKEAIKAILKEAYVETPVSPLVGFIFACVCQ